MRSGPLERTFLGLVHSKHAGVSTVPAALGGWVAAHAGVGQVTSRLCG
jgi:hypothetical protein